MPKKQESEAAIETDFLKLDMGTLVKRGAFLPGSICEYERVEFY